MVTRLLFAAALLLVGLWVVGDIFTSKLNTSRLLEIGARISGRWQTRSYLALVLLWGLGSSAEIIILERSLTLFSAIVGLTLLLMGRHLRKEARAALGQRWTLDVVSLPGNPLVTGQIYDRMRHPEYLGTLLVLVGVPLIHGAWFSVLLTLLAAVVLLYLRVRLEERVLNEDARYLSLMGDRPRFFPRRPPHNPHEPSAPTKLYPRSRRDNLPTQP